MSCCQWGSWDHDRDHESGGSVLAAPPRLWLRKRLFLGVESDTGVYTQPSASLDQGQTHARRTQGGFWT